MGEETLGAGRTILVTAAGVLSFLIVLSNGVAIALLTRSSRRLEGHGPSHRVLVSLCLAHLLCGLCLPALFYGELVLGHYSPFCVGVMLTTTFSCMVSILHQVLISVERYLALSRPLHYPMLATPRRTLGAILATWLLSLGVILLNFIPQKRDKSSNVSCHDVFNLPFFSAFVACFLIIPVVVLIATYLLIFRIARSHHQRLAPRVLGRRTTSDEDDQDGKNVSITSNAARTFNSESVVEENPLQLYCQREGQFDEHADRKRKCSYLSSGVGKNSHDYQSDFEKRKGHSDENENADPKHSRLSCDVGRNSQNCRSDYESSDKSGKADRKRRHLLLSVGRKQPSQRHQYRRDCERHEDRFDERGNSDENLSHSRRVGNQRPHPRCQLDNEGFQDCLEERDDPFSNVSHSGGVLNSHQSHTHCRLGDSNNEGISADQGLPEGQTTRKDNAIRKVIHSGRVFCSPHPHPHRRHDDYDNNDSEGLPESNVAGKDVTVSNSSYSRSHRQTQDFQTAFYTGVKNETTFSRGHDHADASRRKANGHAETGTDTTTKISTISGSVLADISQPGSHDMNAAVTFRNSIFVTNIGTAKTRQVRFETPQSARPCRSCILTGRLPGGYIDKDVARFSPKASSPPENIALTSTMTGQSPGCYPVTDVARCSPKTSSPAGNVAWTLTTPAQPPRCYSDSDVTRCLPKSSSPTENVVRTLTTAGQLPECYSDSDVTRCLPKPSYPAENVVTGTPKAADHSNIFYLSTDTTVCSDESHSLAENEVRPPPSCLGPKGEETGVLEAQESTLLELPSREDAPRKAPRQRDKVKGSAGRHMPSSLRETLRSTKILGILCCYFFVSWTPFLVYGMLEFTVYDDPQPPLYFALLTLIGGGSSFGNTVLYFFTQHTVRVIIKEKFLCAKHMSSDYDS